MVNPEVATWLNGDRDYDHGVALLRSINPDAFVLSILDSGDDEYNGLLLFDELHNNLHCKNSTWADVAKAIPVIEIINTPDESAYLQDAQDASAHIICALRLTPEQVGTLVLPLPEPTARDHKADTAKKIALKKRAGELWKEMSHHKGAMSQLRPGKALHKISRELLSLNAKRQDIWDQIDFFDEYGYWHDEQKEKVVKPANLEQKIKNVMSYRTKAQKMLERPLTRSQREYQEKRIAEFNQQIAGLQSLREAV
jgi:hypothetical protein